MKLGYTPTRSTSIKPIPANILALVPKPTGVVKTIKSGREDVETDTMPFIMQRIKATAYQTKQLAQLLKGNTQQQSLRNAWNFVKEHIRYVEDDPTNEEVRDPSVTIHQGKGDCDCMTVLIASILYNLGIDFYLRIIKQNNNADWTHIYLIVPKSNAPKRLTQRSQYTVLDCVTDRFDYEPDFTQHQDYTNMGLAGLKSLRGISSEESCLNKRPEIEELKMYVSTESVVDHGMVPTQTFLNDTKIPYTAITNNDGSKVLVIDTESGPVALPTILTKDEATIVADGIAEKTTAAIAEAADTITNSSPKNKGLLWLVILIGAGILVGAALKSGAKSKAKVVNRLGGIEKNKTSRARTTSKNKFSKKQSAPKSKLDLSI